MLRGITRRPAASYSCISRPRRALVPVAAGCAALLLIAGCGPAKSAAATAPSSSGSAGSSMTAYLTCLRQHDVNVPTARPTVRPTARPTGGFGAGSTTMQKARQACASLRPAGGFGFGGRFAAAFQAFRTCMASHGVTLPASRPNAPPSPPDSGAPRAGRFLNGLDPNDPKVAAALKACQSKLPTFPRPAASPSAA
ncbi:MAG: hypothetical protein ACHQCE_08570 [Streptosporangiales bacterium]